MIGVRMSDKHTIRGCIFDFDGTIIISEHVHMRAWEDLAKSESRHLPDGFLDASVGMSDGQLIKILAKAWHDDFPESVLLTLKRKFYMDRCPAECHAVPGVVDVIHALSDRGVPLALATSSSRDEVQPVLGQLGILSLFKKLWTVEDVVHAKPDPEIYKMAAKSLSLEPKDCLAFEDSLAGVESARSAGCPLITVRTLYDEIKLGPAILSIRDFRDDRLKPLLNKIEKSI